MHDHHATISDAADHVSEARLRARQMLAGESHLGAVDDWRRVLVTARDTMILVWLTWVALHAFGDPPFTGYLLVAMAAGLAVMFGISTGRSTHAQVEYYASELDRERREIHEHFEHEQEEVRVLYAAKGFREPLLGQIVDTLSADDDRLLKVMMEEELGLSMHHMEHPLIVGLSNFAGALVAGLVMSVPLLWLSGTSEGRWMAGGGAGLLAVVSVLSGRATGRSDFEFFTVGLIMAVVTGGVVFFLAQWLAGFVSPAV